MLRGRTVLHLGSSGESKYVFSIPGSRIRQNSGNAWRYRKSVRSLGDLGYRSRRRFLALGRHTRTRRAWLAGNQGASTACALQSPNARGRFLHVARRCGSVRLNAGPIDATRQLRRWTPTGTLRANAVPEPHPWCADEPGRRSSSLAYGGHIESRPTLARRAGSRYAASLAPSRPAAPAVYLLDRR